MKLCPECYGEYQDDQTECPEDSSVLTMVDDDPLIGTKIAGRYTVLSIVGRGGMGVVYKAKHDLMDRLVAIKMLHSHLVSDAEALKRFHREAKAVSRVQHPHTITLYDFGITPSGQPFIVMDYIEGTHLKRIISQYGPVPLSKVAHIFKQVVEALACAHKEGVIHRDLKPENIMLTKRGNDEEWVEVVDFGISMLMATEQSPKISRITRIGDVCGSPPYMSPEQCISSLQIDTRSDIYSLGVVLYESLTGRLPFRTKSAVEMIDCHLYAPPSPLRVANPELACCESLNSLLVKALQKEPDNRQQTMEEFGAQLSEAIKLDSLKLKALKQKLEVESFENLVSEAKAHDDGKAAPEAAGKTEKEELITGGGRAQESGGLYAIRNLIGNALSSLLNIGNRSGANNRSYVLSNCPYCGCEIEPQVNFCLSCGRNLASPQDAAKLRPAQHVFAYPKFQKSQAASPRFSKKARMSAGKHAHFLGMSPGFLVVVLIVVAYLSQTTFGKQVFDTTIKGAGDMAKQLHLPF